MKLCRAYMSASKTSERAERESLFEDIKKWYLEQYRDYELKLKSDMLSEMAKQFEDQLNDWDQLSIKGYKDNSSAKAGLFDRVEHACKLILSVYTYGPDTSFPATFSKFGCSWFDYELKFHILIELVQAQLKANGEGKEIDLAVYLEDRSVRNGLAHNGKALVCVSAIRCYNVLRDMLIFLDPECRSNLPRFSYPEATTCDLQRLMQQLKNFNFRNESTLLVVSPLHDLKPDALRILGNLPWSAVIDLDGYSQFGGLRSMVNNPCINDQLLIEQTAKSFSVRRGFTAWFTCGEFASFTFNQPDPNDTYKWDNFLKKYHARFDGKTAFGGQGEMEKCIKSIIKEFSKSLRPLNILYIHDYDDDSELARRILNECEQEFHQQDLQYSMTAVYYDSPDGWDKQRKKLEKDYADSDYSFPLDNHFCDLDSMADGLIQFHQDLPIVEPNAEPFRLPSEQGMVSIGQVMANNLSDCFDVLYEDAGIVSAEQTAEQLRDFFRGGAAEWSVFRDGQVVPLYPERDYERLKQKIVDLLSHIPDPDSKLSKVITISHTPGIGGSTLLRQIGWDLHTTYPVLMVKRYDSKISNHIKRLYDHQKKGVFLIADDTVNELDRLKKDISLLDRPCALVLTARDSNEKSRISFSVIDPQMEPQLRKRFRDNSLPYQSLSSYEKEVKESKYESFIRQDGMRCPFMIGLYYQETDFNGVAGYVSRMMGQVQDRREVQTLAILALFGKYVGCGLPQYFIDKYLQIRPGSTYIKKYPYVKAVVISAPNELLNTCDTYKVKHYLIAGELLEQCCQRLYGSSLKNSLTDLSTLVINAIFNAYKSRLDEVYEYLLESLFITKDDNRFSPLIMAAAAPTNRKEILCKLAETFDALTQQYTPEEAEGLYHMTAHFYGHLGRLCYNRDYGLDNPNEAKVFCERGVDLIEKTSQKNGDATMYHMLGSARSALFRRKLDAVELSFQDNPNTPLSVELYSELEEELEEIRAIFEKTAAYGSENYAIPSLIKLYLQYLKKIHRWENNPSPVRISERQIRYRNEIERLFEWSYSMDLDDDSNSIIKNAERDYQAEFSQNGDTISYYEQRLSALKGKFGVDEEILSIRHGLIAARLYRHFNEVRSNPDQYTVLKAKELLSVLEQIEEVLGSQFDPYDFRQRQNRIICYDRWFYLAKMPGAGRTLEKAIDYSERWIDLEDQYGGSDPRPYYYYAVCSLLYKLAGNFVDPEKIRSRWKRSEDLGKSKDRPWDFVVKGTGMEQLFDVRHAAMNPVLYFEQSGRTPLTIEGTFERISADRGYIRLLSPREWERSEVKFTRGRVNALDENQLTHKLATFVGFTYEGFRAIDKYVRDITAHEGWPRMEAPLPSGKMTSANWRRNPRQSEPNATISQDVVDSLGNKNACIGNCDSNPANDVHTNKSIELSANSTEKICVSEESNKIIGKPISLQPLEMTDNGCIGIFEITDVQYKGQILYAKVKNRNKAKKLKAMLSSAKQKKQAVPGFRVAGLAKDGVYILQLV